MSNVPAELKYSKEHEWLRKEADGTYTVWYHRTCPGAVRRYGVC
ncbi:glycine cleavage system protein H [Escherichia coli]|nr:glycine cleavage system protein H [Escherichia coli]